jgi:imidazole glycerol-phosphate synthase subunit HisF
VLTKRVIPCLDVANGRVVKGVRFVDLRDAGDPRAAAAAYEAAGADEIVFLDISASHEGRSTLLDVVRATADGLFIPLTVGGGVTSVEHFDALLRAGAEKVAVNTAAVVDPSIVQSAAERFGSQCVVAAVDVRREGDRWRVFTHGGKRQTDLEGVAWCAKLVALGAGEILLTSMDRDGTKQGFDVDLLRAVSSVVRVPVIASGGAGTVAHFVEAVQAGASAVLAASLFHFNELTVGQVKSAMAVSGIPVRVE